MDAFNNRDELQKTAGIKTEADSDLLSKIRTAEKVYWAFGALIFVVASVTVWVVTIRLDVNYLQKSNHLLWEKVFGTPLP